MKAGFLEKLIERLGRIGPEDVQNYFLRLAQEKGFLETVFNAIQEGRKTILGDYAGTNYHEFWAVSVEVFFENPIRLKHELPLLYDSMARLLKQDPMELFLNARRGSSTLVFKKDTISNKELSN